MSSLSQHGFGTGGTPGTSPLVSAHVLYFCIFYEAAPASGPHFLCGAEARMIGWRERA